MNEMNVEKVIAQRCRALFVESGRSIPNIAKAMGCSSCLSIREQNIAWGPSRALLRT